jgi:uncharacterized protein involved in tolerance to divalent cations
MINVVIYLKKKNDPKALIKILLDKKLIASASIDENNRSFHMEGSDLVEDFYTVITAQSKALLFNEITKIVEEHTGEETPVNATPIVGTNRIFDQTVRSKTIPI